MRAHRFDFVVTLACFALLGYFAWHAWQGPRGYPYRDRLVAEAASLEGRLAAVTAERNKIEGKVVLLRPNRVDPDLLDELARSRLEMARPLELVIMRKQIPQAIP
jgi:cell division protein FtsB